MVLDPSDAALGASGVAALTASGDMVTVLNLAGIDPDLEGFSGAFEDGTYGHHAQNFTRVAAVALSSEAGDTERRCSSQVPRAARQLPVGLPTREGGTIPPRRLHGLERDRARSL